MNIQQRAIAAKEKALEQCRELHVDAVARTVAFAGQEGKTNVSSDLDTPQGPLCLRATSGAGTNSTSARLGDTHVYRANDYGKHVKCFRYGPWVSVLTEIAKEIKTKKAKAAQAEEDKKAQVTLADFSPLPEA